MRHRVSAAAAALGLSVTSLSAVAAPQSSMVSDTSFNPAIGLIIDAQFADFSAHEGGEEVPGFLLGPETGRDPEGFSLAETELNISSNIDDMFYGHMTAAIHQTPAGEAELEIEEAYIQTLAMPAGLTVKAGKFFSDIGYQNNQHPHSWDFADGALPYRAFLANHYKDEGVQLRWVPPTPFYLELGTELMRGIGFPAAGAADEGRGAGTFFARTGGDFGVGHSWQAGVSALFADAIHRSAGGHGHGHDEGTPGDTLEFTGDSDLYIADFVYKWAPRGNPRNENLVVEAEYFRRDETGVLELIEPDGTEFDGLYDGRQSGYYLQAAWQFMPRWRVGARHARLSSDNTVTGLPEETPLDEDDFRPEVNSLMMDFSNSEFSRLRLQFNRDESSETADNQVILQYIVSIGAHGAHSF